MVAVGIDFGTTNTVVAYKGDSGPARLVLNSKNQYLTPSVVCWRRPLNSSGNGAFLVGKEAQCRAYHAPTDAIFGVKRLLGRHHDDPQVRELRNLAGFSIQRASDGEGAGLCVVMAGRLYRLEEIAALIFRKVKADAELRLKGLITHAVVTVPACFGERQRAAVRQAALQAGLVVKKIVDEPMAAAIPLVWAAEDTELRRVLVYRFGGGTFDTAILEMCGRHAQTVHVEGDSWLGGDDFDCEIMNRLIGHLVSTYGLEPITANGRSQLMVLIKLAAERAKKELSTLDRTNLCIKENGQNVNLRMEVTREQFESQIRPYIDRSIALAEKSITTANLKVNDIHHVILAGGSTLIPSIRRDAVTSFRDRLLHHDIDPRHLAALGAAEIAASFQGVECSNSACAKISGDESVLCPHCGTLLWPPPPDMRARGLMRDQESESFRAFILRRTSYSLKLPAVILEAQGVVEGMAIDAMSEHRELGMVMYAHCEMKSSQSAVVDSALQRIIFEPFRRFQLLSLISPLFRKVAETLLRRPFRDRTRPDGMPLYVGPTDCMDCTVFAPPKVSVGQKVLVQVWVHVPEKADEARELASEMDSTTRLRAFAPLDRPAPEGTRHTLARLTFGLTIPGLEIDDPVRSLVWRWRTQSVQFGVTVPSGRSLGNLIGTVTIAQDTIPIGRVKFSLFVEASAARVREMTSVSDGMKRYTFAFVSYASKDLDKVLARVQMLNSLGIRYFMDLLHLEPGDPFERKLYRQIDECDLFLLFWSSSARDSKWVLNEVRYALSRKAGDDLAPPEIRPVIIEGPPIVEPPEELAHLHFNDKLRYFMGK